MLHDSSVQAADRKPLKPGIETERTGFVILGKDEPASFFASPYAIGERKRNAAAQTEMNMEINIALRFIRFILHDCERENGQAADDGNGGGDDDIFRLDF